MNSGCAPQRVRRRHVTDEHADLLIYTWPAARSAVRSSGPSAAEPIAMPPDNGVRLHNHQRRAPVLPDPRQSDPKQSIATFEAGAVRGTFHRRQLLPQRQVLQDQFSMAAKRQRQCAGDDDKQLQHASIVAGVDAKNQRRRVLARVTGRIPSLFCPFASIEDSKGIGRSAAGTPGAHLPVLAAVKERFRTRDSRKSVRPPEVRTRPWLALRGGLTALPLQRSGKEKALCDADDA
jgi:hypothetical protein